MIIKKIGCSFHLNKLWISLEIHSFLHLLIKFPFSFIRSILKLREIAEYKDLVEKFYVDAMSEVFRTNLDFEHYTPWYDYYN